jgi:hypothetical protein
MDSSRSSCKFFRRLYAQAHHVYFRRGAQASALLRAQVPKSPFTTPSKRKSPFTKKKELFLSPSCCQCHRSRCRMEEVDITSTAGEAGDSSAGAMPPDETVGVERSWFEPPSCRRRARWEVPVPEGAIDWRR